MSRWVLVMAQLAEVAREHAALRRRLGAAAAGEAARLWGQVDPGRIAGSWLSLLPRLLLLLTGAQQAAAGQADGYLNAVLDAQGINPATEGRVAAAALAGVASDGRDLASLLYQPAVSTLVGVQRGATVDQALAGGRAGLDMIVRTQVADAGRVADLVATAARNVPGYRRMLVGKSCSRCAILAGKFYRWNAGFDRHPRCDCVHVPAREDTADEIRTDPKKHFASLSHEEQDRVFTKAGAEAVRLGADIGQVVNARRGARGLTTAGARVTGDEARMLRGGRDRGRLEAVDVYGRQLFITSEGVTTRGVAGIRLGARETGQKADGARYRSAKPPRLMPESVLAIAGNDRDEARRLLRRFGYLL